MEKESKKILQLFQCDYNRELEESFAQILSERDNIRVFFINEDRAFTDGKNIVIDPSYKDGFCDVEALKKVEHIMNLPPNFSKDPWNALRMITRGLNIHETLHIIYTSFPSLSSSDGEIDSKGKKYAISLIENIIEDVYIEGVGACVYDNLELYLRFLRLVQIFSEKEVNDTATERLEEMGIKDSKLSLFIQYINYMGLIMLYPNIELREPSIEINDYVNKTKRLFMSGALAPSPRERYKYSKDIFNIILPLIPEDSDNLDYSYFENILYGMRTHNVKDTTISRVKNKGKTQEINRTLFEENKDFNEEIINVIEQFTKEKEAALIILNYRGYGKSFYGNLFDCSPLHNNIKINETKPKINFNGKRAYQNIYKKYHININSYNSRFSQLLKANVTQKEDKVIFGVGIESKNLGDYKKRYWYRNNYVQDVPELGVLLLIDGSGSMRGERRESAITSSVILHEVLKKRNIQHAIIEHRAQFEEAEIDINILVGFNSKEEEKFNLMEIDSYGDNRDALALFWCERYMNSEIRCENKLIIVISDGVPAHEADDYYPPVSTMDTKNAVLKIMKRGINIISVALDNNESFSCYDELNEIYPNLIACNDLKRLTGQILNLVSKSIK